MKCNPIASVLAYWRIFREAKALRICVAVPSVGQNTHTAEEIDWRVPGCARPAMSSPHPGLCLLRHRVASALCKSRLDALSVDQDKSLVDELLSGAVVLLVANQRRQGKDKLNGQGRRAFASGSNGRAEVHTVETGAVLEPRQDGANEVGNVLVKGQGGRAISGAGLRFFERRGNGELQVRAVAEGDKRGFGVSDKVRVFVQFPN